MQTRPRLRPVAFLVALTLAATLPAASNAATFVVNSTVDQAGSAPLDDGVCETAPGNGVCTLRAAIQEANHSSSAYPLVRVPAGTYVLTIPPNASNNEATGDLVLTGTTIVEGAAPSATGIDANHLGSAFYTIGTAAVIRNLSVFGARDDLPDEAGSGIVNQGVLSLENVHLFDNQALSGGAVANFGVLALRHCVVRRNFTNPFGGGAIANVGGTVSIVDSVLTENQIEFGNGAAVLNSGGNLTIERTAIYGNESFFESEGAAIHSDQSSGLLIVNSSIDENRSSGHGGGIAVFGGIATLINVLVVANEATLGDAGIYVGPLASSVQVKNSLISSNSGPLDFDECGPNPITSLDYLVISYPATCAILGVVTHVNVADLPFLHIGERLPNGGFGPLRNPDTPETSNQIPPVNCTDGLGNPLLTDQRGYVRSDGACDIGSYEAGAWLKPDPIRGRNLLRNAGAAGDELGIARPQSIDLDLPYWRQSTGSVMEQVLYGLGGGFPGTADAPPGGGSYFFSGGSSTDSSRVQEFDLSAVGAQIDAGTLRYDLSGWFGGRQDDDDFAQLSVEFWSPESGFVAIDTIGGFDADDRNDQTKLLHDAATGFVPVDARYAYVFLRATRAGAEPDAYNDGYADKLSFSVPEPNAFATAIAAFAALAVLRSRSALR